jgi:hypothetical protein
VLAQSSNGGSSFSPARLLETFAIETAPRLSHLALAAHPTRAGLSYLMATRDNKDADGFGVRVALAPLFASVNNGTLEALREQPELRARDQFQWGQPQLLVDAERSQLVMISTLRDLTPRVANPLIALRPDLLQLSTANIPIAATTIAPTLRFNAARTITTLLPLKPGAFASVGSAQIPVNPGLDALSVAMDRQHGRYFVAYSDARGTDAMNLTVSLVSSSDGGLNWREPTVIEGRKGQAFWRPSVAVDSSGALAVTVMRGRGSSTQPAAGFRVESYLTRYQVSPIRRHDSQVLSDLSIERESSELFDQYTYKTDFATDGFATPVAWPLISLPQRCMLPIVQRHLDRPQAAQQIDLAKAIFADSAQSCL